MKKRKIKEFIEQAKKYDIRYWNITHCPEHYKTIYYEIIDNKVWINHCPKCAIQPRKKSSWKTIADNFNSFKSPQDITSANKWWKFEEPIDLDVKIELFEFFFSAGMTEYDIDQEVKSFYLDEIKPFVFNLMKENPMIAVAINVYAYKGEFEYFFRIVAEVKEKSKYNYVLLPRTFLRKDLLKSKDKMDLCNWIKELAKEKPELDFSGRPPQQSKD